MKTKEQTSSKPELKYYYRRDFAAEWNQVPNDQEDRYPIVAQVIGTNRPRQRQIGEVQIGERKRPVKTIVRVKVLYQYDSHLNRTVVAAVRNIENDLTQVPQKPLDEVKVLYRSEDISPRTLETVLSHGATSKELQLEKGDPDYLVRIPQGSFRSPVIGKLISERRNQLRLQREQELRPTAVVVHDDLDDIEF